MKDLENIDYIEISRLLIAQIRKGRSQGQINRAFKCSYNKAFQWESGRIQIAWMDFVELCILKRIPLMEILEREIGFWGDKNRTGELISFLLQGVSNQRASKFMGISGHLVADLKRGHSTLKLSHVLAALDIYNGCSKKFIDKLIKNENPDPIDSKLNSKFAVLFVEPEQISLIGEFYQKFIDQVTTLHSSTGTQKVTISYFISDETDQD